MMMDDLGSLESAKARPRRTTASTHLHSTDNGDERKGDGVKAKEARWSRI